MVYKLDTVHTVYVSIQTFLNILTNKNLLIILVCVFMDHDPHPLYHRIYGLLFGYLGMSHVLIAVDRLALHKFTLQIRGIQKSMNSIY